MTKVFQLAVAEVNGDVDERLPFQVEGGDEQLYAYRPTEGQLVLLMGLDATHVTASAASAVMEMFWGLMDEDTTTVLRRRLADRHDPFGVGEVLAIINWIVEETAARPTQSSLASLPSRATNGHLSTGGVQRKRSTRSASRPIASTA